jgi:hypothetical protein
MGKWVNNDPLEARLKLRYEIRCEIPTHAKTARAYADEEKSREKRSVGHTCHCEGHTILLHRLTEIGPRRKIAKGILCRVFRMIFPRGIGTGTGNTVCFSG